MDRVIEAVREAWGWCGVEPVEILRSNEFGNLLILDAAGAYWRLCPEDVYCEQVASNREELETLVNDEEFLFDWEMTELVSQAQRTVGRLQEGYSYCLKIPGLLGGQYGGDNLASVPTIELIRFSGNLAEQTKDLPAGAQIELRIVD